MSRALLSVCSVVWLAACADPLLAGGADQHDDRPWVERAAAVDAGALSLSSTSERLHLDLFGETTAVNLRSVTHANGAIVWSGVPDTDRHGEVTLVRHGEAWAGTVRRHDQLIQLLPGPGGRLTALSIDPGAMPSDEEPLNAAPSADNARWPARVPNDSVIDVLVGYTTQSRIAAGSRDAMEATIALAMAESNQGYADSGLAMRLRLVGTREVSGRETPGQWADTLDDLRTDGDGFADEIHDERDNTGADEVVLIVEDATACGIAYVMTEPGPSFSEHAFATVSRTCATGYYSFAHEVGHNMGSAHHASFGEEGAYDWSYGHRDPDANFRTVMAYNCPGGCQRINRWSDPSATWDGLALGAAHGDDEPADNVGTLDDVRGIVAGFRATQSAAPPAAALSAPTGTAITGGFTELEWNRTGATRVTVGMTPGDGDYVDSTVSGGALAISGLPVDGTDVWVSLHTAGGRVDTRFSTNAASTLQWISPATTLNRADQTFLWTDTGAGRYRLSIGTSAGSADVMDVISNDPTVHARRLPTAPLFIRIGHEVEGEWVYETRSW